MDQLTRLKVNRDAWNKVAGEYYGHSCLPALGAFGEGAEDPKLLGSIKGKVFLELCCGSGHSIKYLIKHGAKKVYGVDFSKKQISFAAELNRNAVNNGSVDLLQVPMEKRLLIKNIDTVFSIYGLGWTVNPDKVLTNVFSYLKHGGRFIWSWDHAFFRDTVYKDGEYIIKYSYHDQEEMYRPGWSGSKGAYLTYYKSSTWFRYLTHNGFQVVDYLEPNPTFTHRNSPDPASYYSPVKAQLVPATIIFVCKK